MSCSDIDFPGIQLNRIGRRNTRLRKSHHLTKRRWESVSKVICIPEIFPLSPRMHFSQADESKGVQVGTKPMVTAWLNGLLPFRGDSNGGGGQGLDNLKKLFSESCHLLSLFGESGVYVRGFFFFFFIVRYSRSCFYFFSGGEGCNFCGAVFEWQKRMNIV